MLQNPTRYLCKKIFDVDWRGTPSIQLRTTGKKTHATMSRMADRNTDASMPVKDHGSFVYHAPSDADIQGKLISSLHLSSHPMPPPIHWTAHDTHNQHMHTNMHALRHAHICTCMCTHMHTQYKWMQYDIIIHFFSAPLETVLHWLQGSQPYTVCMHYWTWSHTDMWMYMRTHTHTHTHACMHACMHTPMHTRTHTHRGRERGWWAGRERLREKRQLLIRMTSLWNHYSLTPGFMTRFAISTPTLCVTSGLK